MEERCFRPPPPGGLLPVPGPATGAAVINSRWLSTPMSSMAGARVRTGCVVLLRGSAVHRDVRVRLFVGAWLGMLRA